MVDFPIPLSSWVWRPWRLAAALLPAVVSLGEIRRARDIGPPRVVALWGMIAGTRIVCTGGSHGLWTLPDAGPLLVMATGS